MRPIHLRSICLLALTLLLPSLIWGERAGESETSASSPEIELVGRLLVGLKTDADAQARYGLQVFEVLLEAGHPDEAKRTASEIPGYRRQVALFRMAEYWARTQQRDASNKAFEEASKAGDGTLDFERDEVRRAKAIALAARGEEEAAKQVARQILSQPMRMDAAAYIVRLDAPEKVDAAVQRLSEMQGATPANRARVLVRAADAQYGLGEMSRTVRLLRAAAEEVVKAYGVETLPLMREIVERLVRCGEMDEAGRWAEVALGFALRVDPRAEWKPRELRLAAESLRWAGKEKEANAVLDELPNAPGALDPMGYPRGGMDAALGFLMQGKTEIFDKAALHVIRHGRMHPHHRARAMAGIEVVCAYLRARRPMPDEVRVALQELIQSVESDPQWIRPV